MSRIKFGYTTRNPRAARINYSYEASRLEDAMITVVPLSSENQDVLAPSLWFYFTPRGTPNAISGHYPHNQGGFRIELPRDSLRNNTRFEVRTHGDTVERNVWFGRPVLHVFALLESIVDDSRKTLSSLRSFAAYVLENKPDFARSLAYTHRLERTRNFATDLKLSESYLIDEILPTVEGAFRISAGSDNFVPFCRGEKRDELIEQIQKKAALLKASKNAT